MSFKQDVLKRATMKLADARSALLHAAGTGIGALGVTAGGAAVGAGIGGAHNLYTGDSVLDGMRTGGKIGGTLGAGIGLHQIVKNVPRSFYRNYQAGAGVGNTHPIDYLHEAGSLAEKLFTPKGA